MAEAVAREPEVPPAAAVRVTIAVYRNQQWLVPELDRTPTSGAGAAGGRQTRRRAPVIWDLHDTLVQELAGNRILLQAAERDWGASGRDEAQDVVLVTPGRHDLARAMIADLGGERANRTDHTAAAEAMATMRPRSASFIPGRKALARDAFEKYTSSMCSDATTRPP